MVMTVLRSAGKEFDYLVGARLDGFPQSVNITDAPLIICEGDEYPASVLEKRPKFHFLFPHIAVLTGIAWDHINVFPTWELYLEQFRIFLSKIEPGGLLIYNETDHGAGRAGGGTSGGGSQDRLWHPGTPDNQWHNRCNVSGRDGGSEGIWRA